MQKKKGKGGGGGGGRWRISAIKALSGSVYFFVSRNKKTVCRSRVYYNKTKTKQNKKGVKDFSRETPPYRHSRYRLLNQHHIDEVP